MQKPSAHDRAKQFSRPRVITFRQFLNSDPPGLARVMTEHFRAAGLDAPIDGARLDALIFSRLLFDPQQYLVAVDDAQPDQPLAFCHWTELPPAPPETSPRLPEISLALICVGTHSDRAGLAQALLQTAEVQWRARQASLVLGGTLHPHGGPYLGMPPLHGLAGVPDADHETAAWLSERGFVPRERWEHFSLSLDQLRAPVDRELLLLRRQCAVQPFEAPPPVDRRRALAAAGFDIEGFRLTEPRQPTAQRTIEMWLDDPEFGPSGSTGAILNELPADNAADPRYRLLLAEALRALAQQRRLRVVTALPLGSPWAPFLAALGFRASGLGAIFQKQLTGIA